MSGKEFAEKYSNVADPRLGAKVTYATDDFFAPKERLITPTSPVFIPGKYDENGKWMDGWESRRKRVPGHDSCIVELGGLVRLFGADIETTHFVGNSPLAASLDYCHTDETNGLVERNWRLCVSKFDITPDTHNFAMIEEVTATHVRLNIYPDGGVARLRLYGEFIPKADSISDETDLAALRNGGRAVACNNEHFGTMRNLILPPPASNMGDGWETRRRREPGNDWVVLALARPSKLRSIEIDTSFFKGNYPDRCTVQAALAETDDDDLVIGQSGSWAHILDEQQLRADSVHVFEEQLAVHEKISHIRLNIIPDGGVARVHVYGRADA